jgi:hypothetical protein
MFTKSVVGLSKDPLGTKRARFSATITIGIPRTIPAKMTPIRPIREFLKCLGAFKGEAIKLN